jgi:hypothetical protein
MTGPPINPQTPEERLDALEALRDEQEQRLATVEALVAEAAADVQMRLAAAIRTVRRLAG